MNIVHMLWFGFFLIFQGINLGAYAQSQESFTRQDSLRGFLFPERANYDVIFYDLQIEFNIDKKQIQGWNDIHFRVKQDLPIMQLDLAENLKVSAVLNHGDSIEFTREGNALFLLFKTPLTKGNSYAVRIMYEGSPQIAANPPWDGGFIWTKDNNGSPWIAVACQLDGASLWFPCKDHPSDEPEKVRMTYVVPAGLKAIGNGQLIQTRPLDSLRTSYTWLVTHPINIYNITFYIGQYAFFSDTMMGQRGLLKLDYHVLPYQLEKAKKHFEQVKPMMHIFEHLFGPYPFYNDGYKLVEAPYAGMEHQSAIAYGNQYMKGYYGRYPAKMDFDYIIIHETGHEWWGNSISVFDVADLWIHEGFCTYAEALYVEERYGYEDMLIYLNDQRKYIDNLEPIIGSYHVNREGSGDMYYKGSWILQTLRFLMQNDSLWKKTIYDIATTYEGQIVQTKDIESFIQQRFSDVSLDAFFNQYLRNHTLPVLQYRTKKKKDQWQFTVSWTNTIETFDMPVGLLVGNEWVMIPVKTTPKTFSIKIPKNVRWNWSTRLQYYDVKKI